MGTVNKKLSANLIKKKTKERRIKKILHSANLSVFPDEVDYYKQSHDCWYDTKARCSDFVVLFAVGAEVVVVLRSCSINYWGLSTRWSSYICSVCWSYNTCVVGNCGGRWLSNNRSITDCLLNEWVVPEIIGVSYLEEHSLSNFLIGVLGQCECVIVVWMLIVAPLMDTSLSLPNSSSEEIFMEFA